MSRSPHRIGCKPVARAARRPNRAGVLLAVGVLLFQLFVTQVHSFMGPLGWSDPAANPMPSADASQILAQAAAAQALCTVPGETSGKAVPGQPHGKSQECPIFQSLPLLSASLAAQPIELPPPSEFGPPLWIARAETPLAVPLHLRPPTRAPPLSL
jgi:hypothetical protein